MIYPENFEEKIGIDQIRNLIQSHCLCPLGVDRVRDISFSSDSDFLQLQFLYLEEFREIIMMEESFPLNHYFDLRPILSRLKIANSTVTTEELHKLELSLKTISKLLNFFKGERKEKYPKLSELSKDLVQPNPWIVSLGQILDEKGRIRDRASDELYSIRRELRSLLSKGRNKLQSMLNAAKKNGWSRDDAELSLRNGRVVIPVLASYKRSIKGFIHDESATGQTSFVEPLEMFETNNRIAELEIAETNEIRKILMAFCDSIRSEIPYLLELYYYLGDLDFIRAKTKFMLQLDAQIPHIISEMRMDWKGAKHPLLFLAHKAKGKEVVPLDISLDQSSRILIVSGPNAGGKSVLLKTVALNQYMFQCGLPVLARDMTEMCLFENVFLDIGDEQSLENDLSTYSSHLNNVKFMVENAHEKTLILIDEFGSGTEPDLGGSIAAASLEFIYEKGSFGVVTTHYAQLKLMGDKFPEIVNGAMSFDTDLLRPKYQFKVGKPGSSFAFEIAQNIGLPKRLLQKAESIIGTEKVHFDYQLQALENDKEKLKKQLQEVEFADKALESTLKKYNQLLAQLKAKEKQIILDAKRKAKEIINDSNRLIENTIAELGKGELNKEKNKRVRQKIAQKKEELNQETRIIENEIQNLPSPPKEIKEGIKKLTGPIEVGDAVIMEGQSVVGNVESISRKNVTVNFDNLRVIVKLNKLMKVAAPKSQKKQASSSKYGSIMADIHERSANFSPNLDLMGKRAEEAEKLLRLFIDEAVLTGNKELEVLHGKGNGVLRSVVRNYLEGCSSVEKFRNAPLEAGGDGKTWISLK